jgi:hypothetical protein
MGGLRYCFWTVSAKIPYMRASVSSQRNYAQCFDLWPLVSVMRVSVQAVPFELRLLEVPVPPIIREGQRYSWCVLHDGEASHLQARVLHVE